MSNEGLGWWPEVEDEEDENEAEDEEEEGEGDADEGETGKLDEIGDSWRLFIS